MMRRLKNQRGFTLVELMIVVAIIGILAALAVYGVRRYISSAKTAEAKEVLGRIGKDATAAYQREKMQGTLMALTSTRDAVNELCPDAVKIPEDAPANAKYQSDPDQWKTDVGWKCLNFSINDPQYFAYEYKRVTINGLEGFHVNAYGDLDGDGEESTYRLEGAVEKGEARVAPTIMDPEQLGIDAE